jgi:hypothetical protein
MVRLVPARQPDPSGAPRPQAFLPRFPYLLAFSGLAALYAGFSWIMARMSWTEPFGC